MPGAGTTRRTIRINDDLWNAAKDLADRNGEDVSALIRRLLAESVAGNDET